MKTVKTNAEKFAKVTGIVKCTKQRRNFIKLIIDRIIRVHNERLIKASMR